MFDQTINIGSIEIPLFVIVFFSVSWLIIIVMMAVMSAKKKSALSKNPDYAKVIGKGVTIQSIDCDDVKKITLGQYPAILLPPGTHRFTVVGSEKSYSGLKGQKTTITSTKPTELELVLKPQITYDLTFDYEEGFQLIQSKKQI